MKNGENGKKNGHPRIALAKQGAWALFGCNVNILADVHKVEHYMQEAARKVGRIDKCHVHKFPLREGTTVHGISGFISFDEDQHGGFFAIHTWPEEAAVCVDLQSSTKSAAFIAKVLRSFAKAMGARRVDFDAPMPVILRGPS